MLSVIWLSSGQEKTNHAASSIVPEPILLGPIRDYCIPILCFQVGRNLPQHWQCVVAVSLNGMLGNLLQLHRVEYVLGMNVLVEHVENRQEQGCIYEPRR